MGMGMRMRMKNGNEELGTAIADFGEELRGDT